MYSSIGVESACRDQESLAARGSADVQVVEGLVELMRALAPDHLVTSISTSRRLAYVETRINCGSEWQPWGLYAVFEWAQARSPGEERWQVISMGRWQP